VLSDPVELAVPRFTRLAVSIYLPGGEGRVNLHRYGQQTAYISPPGDLTAAASLPTEQTSLSRFVLSGVQVLAPGRAGAVIAFGDSLADGFGSTPDADRRWPDRLAQRLASRGGRLRLGVVNAGYFGNRLLHDGAHPDFGHFALNALARFDRDVLAQPGARFVIVQEGINDIGQPELLGRPDEAVTAEAIIAGLEQLIARAHAAGLAIIGGTLSPFEGAPYPGYGTPAGEAKRQAVNRWIRTGKAFDAVIDFDAAVRDPGHPTRLLPVYDSGDALHLNDAGYQAMADAVDLRLFH
jgi:lysophospholipase L1-like esterase